MFCCAVESAVAPSFLVVSPVVYSYSIFHTITRPSREPTITSVASSVRAIQVPTTATMNLTPHSYHYSVVDIQVYLPADY